VTDRNILVGTETADDAAVYRLRDDLAVVATLDFFTPVVDDPYTFGAVAAANSLSDVYAMGGRPLFALSILAFPTTKLPLAVMGEILRGGAEKAAEAGCPIVGGHSIDDAEPKFGLSVVGSVHPDRLLRNVGGRPGDVLFLTKALGTGILTTALKKGTCPPDAEAATVASMLQLNAAASEAALAHGARACTDITGYGLLGHLRGMILSGGLSARLRWRDIALLPSVLEVAAAGTCPGGTRKNLANFGRFTEFRGAWTEEERLVTADAQTSGGLLVAVPPERAAAMEAALAALNVPCSRPVGVLEDGPAGAIVFER
jgi:selenide,water dikinase